MKLPILTRTDNAMPWGLLPLTFLDGPHSAYGVCIFLNKPSFYLLCLTPEFFAIQSQEPTLGSCPWDSPETWDRNTLFQPHSLSCNRLNTLPLLALPPLSSP